MKVTLKAYTQSVDDMTPEEYLISEARVSNEENRLNHDTAPKLLRYLIDSKHWSPFDIIHFNFEIVTSRAIAQQLLRHRSFCFQEFSQRYSEVTEMENFELRVQADKNRQSSTGRYSNMSLIQETYKLVAAAQDLYKRLVADGVAKETARFILPLTTQTTIIMSGSLRSWIHFLEQRCSDHAQKEIRDIANEIKSQLSKKSPWTATALGWV